MTGFDLRQSLSDLIAFQCALVSLRGVGAEASEEMLWQTFLASLVEQYGFEQALYARREDGGVRHAALGPAEPPDDSAGAAAELPIWVEGQLEGQLVVSGGGPSSADRLQQLRILAAEAATMLEERRFRARSEKALKQARFQAEAANRAKSLLLANMSHEIRTPMTGVLGFADLLSSTPLAPRQREYVEMIRSSGKALLTLINDILDFSKVEAGKLTIEKAPFDVRHIVEQSVGLLAVQAAEKHLRLYFHVDPSTPAFVLGDSVRVRQVLVNLVGNAVKFTAAGEVSLAVSAVPHDNGRVRLSFVVRDTGPGIPLEDQDRIFESFSQVDASTTRKYGGTGLGLAISKLLAAEMGGVLRLESRPGCGAAFFFTIPADVAENQAATLPSEERRLGDLPRLRIAVAEDNPVNRMLARAMLERLGYQADMAEDGSELLDRMRSESYDVILMDMHMPGMDGLEATRRIRRDWPADRQPRIVAMTAAAFPEDRARCLAAGMDDYVAKPVGSEELARVLRRTGADARLSAILDPAVPTGA
jgi:signal transduction histidine kinase/ActR/RegA family two-component response regulator